MQGQGVPGTTLSLDRPLERLTDVTESRCLAVVVATGQDSDEGQPGEEPSRFPNATLQHALPMASGGVTLGIDAVPTRETRPKLVFRGLIGAVYIGLIGWLIY